MHDRNQKERSIPQNKKKKKKKRTHQRGSLPKTSRGASGAMFFTPPPPIRSERNKDRLINSRMGVNVAKSSQTPTKVNAVPRSEKREGEKRRRDGGGREDLGL